MPALPGLKETEDTAEWSQTQVISFAVITYFILALYLLAVGIAGHNFFKFVVMGGKFKVEHPLFGFYILTTLCLLSDIIYSLMIIPLYTD